MRHPFLNMKDLLKKKIRPGMPWPTKMPYGEQRLIFNNSVAVKEKKAALCTRIKEVIAQMLDSEELPVTNISVYISGRLQLNYCYLSDVFSCVNGMTIEHYIIQHRIQKAMRLLKKSGEEISSIARRLHYKSCTHFSAQFRAVTGYSPTSYRKMLKLSIANSG
jgi:AraC-like DNA-binding protein